MGNIGTGEVLVVLLLGLLILGPSRLGVVVQQIVKTVRQLRNVASSFQDEIRELVEDPTTEKAARSRGAELGSSGASATTGDEPGSGSLEEPEGLADNPSETSQDGSNG